MNESEVILYIGTKRGLFLATSAGSRSTWTVSEPQLAGREVYHVAVDPRDDSVFASTRHAVWGTHIHRSRDAGRSWELLPATPYHADGRGVEAVWCVAPGPARQPDRLFAGIEPAGLFTSDDAGSSWQPSPLNHHPAASVWQPAGGALALHSITADAFDPHRMWCAVSAGGVYRSDDDGETWAAVNDGTRAEFLADTRPAAGQCVHRLIAHPARAGRLYQQNHCGVYRSDDGGDHWIEITKGLPSDFGYVLATDPADADVLLVVPEESSHMRTTFGGRLCVYRTRDAGATWQPLTHGLPQQNVYVSLLREGMTNDGLSPAGVYLGTSGGHVLASRDTGDTWHLIASWLPRVLSVTAAAAAA